MSGIFIDGFEQFRGAASASALTLAGYEVEGSATPAGGRTGGGVGLRFSNGFIGRVAPWTSSTLAFGAAFNFTDRGTILKVNTGGAWVDLSVSPTTGVLSMGGREGGGLPRKGTWYYAEIVLNRGGNCDVYLNGRLEIPNVPVGGAGATVKVGFGSHAAGAVTGSRLVTIDDIYINDGPRLGPITVTTRFPTGTLVGNWEKPEGVSENHEVVSLIPAQPLDMHLATPLVGTTDVYVSAQELVAGREIVATSLHALARKSPKFEAKLNLSMGDDALLARRSGNVEVDAQWRTHYVCFARNHGDTIAGVVAAPFGIASVPANSP